MILARVVGNVVATQKNKGFIGQKLLLILPIDTEGKPAGEELLAVDGMGAGVGDLVIAINEGGSARQVLKINNALTPVDLVIAGIVDVAESENGTLHL